MCNSDKNIIALATDQPISEMPSNLSTLDLNNVPSVADFVVEYFQFDQS
jgi:hypothetical protein